MYVCVPVCVLSSPVKPESEIIPPGQNIIISPHLTGLHLLVWTLSHADSSLCCPVSTGHSRHPSPTAFFESLCPTPFSRSLTHFRSPEISSPNPLSGFAPKQTKGSSDWRTTYIVLQQGKFKYSLLKVFVVPMELLPTPV